MSIDTIRKELSGIFDSGIFNRDRSRPICLKKIDILGANIVRLNHYLVGFEGLNRLYFHGLPVGIVEFLNECESQIDDNNMPIEGRYLYLTVDNKDVPIGGSQRDAGWHIDGMQGQEIPALQEACYQFTWCSCLPTVFSDIKVDLRGFSRKEYNWFKIFEDMEKESEYSFPSKSLLLSNAYHVHRADQNSSKVDMSRVFLRLYVSKAKITSRKMTINPMVDFDSLGFPVHTTSGNIPDYLK